MATITLSERSSSGYYVNLGDDANDTSIAQTCLVYTKITGAGGNGNGYVFGRTPSSSINGHRLYIFDNSGGPRLTFGGSCSGGAAHMSRPYREGANNSTTTGSWGHYASTWDGGNQSSGILLYAGVGAELAEVGYSGIGRDSGGTPIDAVGKPLYLFNRQGLDRNLDGDVAYIARWNRVLTLTELRQAQADGPLSVPDGLILCWANGQDYSSNAYTPVARATLVEGELPPNTALGGEQGLQASVSASASATGSLTTAISLAASASASASISGTLDYIIALAGDLSASATTSGTLTSVVVKGASITLHAGSTPVGAITGIRALWWDASQPAGAPDYETTTAQTDGSGVLTIDLDGVTALNVSDPGFLLLYKLDGTDHRDSLVFAGRLAVQDIG